MLGASTVTLLEQPRRDPGVGISELEAVAVSRESCAHTFHLELSFITLSHVFYG